MKCFLNSLYALLIAILFTSCSSSLSKEESYQIITTERNINGREVTAFASKPLRVDKLGDKYELYKKYENAGLISIEQTTERVWDSGFTNKPAIITTLTAKGNKSLVENSDAVVELYSYTYDKVDDIKLVKKEVSPLDSKNYRETYLVFFIGSITSVSDFGVVENLSVGERYPLGIKDEPCLYVCELILDYENNERTRTQIHFDTILESEKNSTIEEYNAEQ